MWRRRHILDALAPVARLLLGRPHRTRRRVAVSGLVLAVTVVWAGGFASLSARPASAPLGVVQSFSAALTTAGSQLSATPSVATTSGDLLVAFVRVRNVTATAAVTGVSDSGGNAWTRASAVLGAKFVDEETWYAANANAITPPGSVRVTTTSASAIAMTVVEVSGVATSGALDVTATMSGTGTAASTGTTPVTKAASEIAVADIGWNSAATPSKQTAGYNLLAAVQSSVSGLNTGEQAATRVLSAIGTQSYAATLSSSVAWTGLIATFQAGSLSTPTPTATATATATATRHGHADEHANPHGHAHSHDLALTHADRQSHQAHRRALPGEPQLRQRAGRVVHADRPLPRDAGERHPQRWRGGHTQAGGGHRPVHGSLGGRPDGGDRQRQDGRLGRGVGLRGSFVHLRVLLHPRSGSQHHRPGREIRRR